MSGLMMAHNWFPDPYLTGRLVKPALTNAETAFRNDPFLMLNVKATGDGVTAADYVLSGLPSGTSLTLAANIDTSKSTEDFRPVIVVSDSWEWLGSTDMMHGVARKVSVAFTVPSDGKACLRFYAPGKTGQSCTFSRIILTESESWETIDAVIPANTAGGVFGYDLMPDPRG